MSLSLREENFQEEKIEVDLADVNQFNSSGSSPGSNEDDTIKGEILPETKERPQYKNKAEFLLTCIGFAVGLGNIWRFPKIVQDNGGGAFLIPYVVMFFLEGVPLVYLELSIGQRMRSGSVWKKISKYFLGVSVCSMMISFLIGCYYNTIIAWCLYYLVKSFRSQLPWGYCTTDAVALGCTNATSTQHFFFRNVLDISPAIEVSGGVHSHIAVFLLIAWIVVILCMIKGVQSLGKVVYFTALFPYVIIFIFLVRGLTLEGAQEGLAYFFTPDTSKLLDANIWLAAATQIFFSLSIGFGGMIAFSSFNPIDSDVEASTWIVCCVNSLTSLLGAIIVFSIRGFEAVNQSKDCIATNLQLIGLSGENITNAEAYNDLLTSRYGSIDAALSTSNLTTCDRTTFMSESAGGTGLAFIVFARAVLQMPVPQLWAVLFFFMLILLGLDSMFGNVEGVITPLKDLGLTKKLPHVVVLCIVGFAKYLIALTFTQGSGYYWIDVFDSYAGSIPLLIVAFCELIIVGWFYNYSKFADDMAEILPPANNFIRKAIRFYWKVTIQFLSPLTLFVVFWYYFYIRVTSTNNYITFPITGKVEVPYPTVAVAVGVILTLSCVLWIPGFGVFNFVKSKLIELKKKKGSMYEMGTTSRFLDSKEMKITAERDILQSVI